MTREQLIQKWLDHNLTEAEEQAFMQLDDYAELIKLSVAMKSIAPPAFEVDQQLLSLQKATKKQPVKPINWKRILLPIAAILAICFGIFKFSNNQIKTVETLAAQKESTVLPDASLVELNTNTTISFLEKKWQDSRNVSLNGEAYFKVAKGEKFTVETTSGKVTVFGTQFNVRSRDGLFEVVCFEGSVRVTFEGTDYVLKPGELFSSETGFDSDKTMIDKTPDWINGKSTFKSKQYKHVIAEFERQYDLHINTSNIDINQKFTGSFSHDNLEKALKTITMPLRIKATIIDLKTIQLSSE